MDFTLTEAQRGARRADPDDPRRPASPSTGAARTTPTTSTRAVEGAGRGRRARRRAARRRRRRRVRAARAVQRPGRARPGRRTRAVPPSIVTAASAVARFGDADQIGTLGARRRTRRAGADGRARGRVQRAGAVPPGGWTLTGSIPLVTALPDADLILVPAPGTGVFAVAADRPWRERRAPATSPAARAPAGSSSPTCGCPDDRLIGEPAGRGRRLAAARARPIGLCARAARRRRACAGADRRVRRARGCSSAGPSAASRRWRSASPTPTSTSRRSG